MGALSVKEALLSRNPGTACLSRLRAVSRGEEKGNGTSWQVRAPPSCHSRNLGEFEFLFIVHHSGKQPHGSGNRKHYLRYLIYMIAPSKKPHIPLEGGFYLLNFIFILSSKGSRI